MRDTGDGLGRMFDYIHGLPVNLEDGFDLGCALSTTPLPDGAALLLCGMGGSAIAGDLLAPLVERSGSRLAVWRDYGLPGWLDQDIAVLLSSYSGNTEETLSAARLSAERSALRFGLTTGGVLGDLAEGRGDSGFPCVKLPGGMPPRASLGYGLGALAGLLQGLGVLPGFKGEISAAAALLRETGENPGFGPRPGETVPASAESPAALADAIGARHVVIYTTSAESHPAGLRLKAQLNENAKTPASVERFPELNHNDIVGWELNAAQKDQYALIVLRSADEAPMVGRRVAITVDLLADQFAHIAQIHSRGDRALSRILSLVQFGDYLSCHLAAVRGFDPLPVERIDRLKSTLDKPAGLA